ncbi:tetratricopeptide repeat protein [[Mycobacterium] wendilense]|uniref:Tetratricopeptide repeat protein n=1 Tax=[Mycobacterium] wendilense TaxID=3064284 RepID=A0ABN9NUD0_9MYCO|nr:tetratricopeptide repeat protein [Mycolicibacterium sp. MU0050]CAJ1579856.1 tetratricopeptide repeat protein [Mycolicibacterium sp. MU0050]
MTDTSIDNLEARYLAARDPAEALQTAEALLEARRSELGATHPDTVTTAVAAATWRFHSGDVAGGVEQLRALLPTVVAVLGADDLGTLAARHIVASYPDGADPSPARRLVGWLELYADEQRVLGADHPTTLAARNQIALLRRELGDRIGARDESAAVVEAQRRVLGETHPDTLTGRLSAAMCLGEASDGAAALAAINALIPLLGAAFGYDHQNTLAARQTSALWSAEDGGDLLERFSEWEVLVEDLTGALGERHPLTVAAVAARDEHRDQWEQQGHEAAGLLAGVVDAKREAGRTLRADGPGSVAHLRCRYDLAQRFLRGLRFEAAQRHAEALIADSSTALGDDHELTVAARRLLDEIAERWD